MGLLAALRGKGTAEHPALKYLNSDEEARWLMPATGGLHPLTMLVLGVAAIGGILLTETLPFIQVLLISTVVFLAVAMLTMTRYRMLVINEYEVILLKTRALRTTSPTERLGRFDRIHPFGVRGSMWGQITVGDEKLWVHRRFHATLNAADEALSERLATGAKATNRRASAAASAAYRANRAKKRVKHTKRGRR